MNLSMPSVGHRCEDDICARFETNEFEKNEIPLIEKYHRLLYFYFFVVSLYFIQVKVIVILFCLLITFDILSLKVYFIFVFIFDPLKKIMVALLRIVS
jgi:hypothetical protein